MVSKLASKPQGEFVDRFFSFKLAVYHVTSPDFQYQETAGPPPPNPTTQGPTTEAPPPSDCIDQWIEDGYCDDENNNAACQFDGGDCCNNDGPNWDWYCSVSNQMAQ